MSAIPFCKLSHDRSIAAVGDEFFIYGSDPFQGRSLSTFRMSGDGSPIQAMVNLDENIVHILTMQNAYEIDARDGFTIRVLDKAP